MTEKYRLATQKSFLCGITSDDSFYNVQFTNVQIVKLLNEYVNENQRLKEQKAIYCTALMEAIRNERTCLGRSVLKQFAESLDIDF